MTDAEMNTGFEIWDNDTHNVLQFDHLDEAIAALRSVFDRGGHSAVAGLSLDAVSPDGSQRMTIADSSDLLEVIGATPMSPR